MSFELIKSERLESNRYRAYSYDYFSIVIEKSKELFILSSLATPRALFQTFKGEIASKALE